MERTALQNNSTTNTQDHPLYKLGWSAGLLAGIRWAVAQLTDGQADAEELFREAYKEVSIQEEVSKKDTYLLTSSSSTSSSSLDQVGRVNVLVSAGIYPRPAREIADIYAHLPPGALRDLVQEHIQQLKAEGYKGADLRRLLVWRLRHRVPTPSHTVDLISDIPLWVQCKHMLREQMSAEEWETYIEPLRGSHVDDGLLLLIAPSAETQRTVYRQWFDDILETAQKVDPSISALRIEVAGGDA